MSPHVCRGEYLGMVHLHAHAHTVHEREKNMSARVTRLGQLLGPFQCLVRLDARVLSEL
jgi:hypothetical protein